MDKVAFVPTRDLLTPALKIHVVPYLLKLGFSACTKTTFVRERDGVLHQVMIVRSIYGGSFHCFVCCYLLFDPSERFTTLGRASQRLDGAWSFETTWMADKAARAARKALREQEVEFFGACDSAAKYRDLATVPSDYQFALCETWLGRTKSALRSLDAMVKNGWATSKEKKLRTWLVSDLAKTQLHKVYRTNLKRFKLPVEPKK